MRQHPALTPIARQLALWTDEQLLRRIFSNYRDGRGLRLTKFGQEIMGACFKTYEFTTTEKEHEHPACLLFLDRRAKMPYFWNQQKLIIYDHKFATWLELIGSLTTLVEIDTVE